MWRSMMRPGIVQGSHLILARLSYQVKVIERNTRAERIIWNPFQWKIILLDRPLGVARRDASFARAAPNGDADERGDFEVYLKTFERLLTASAV